MKVKAKNAVIALAKASLPAGIRQVFSM